ncbi:hypothetical protein OBK19_13200 [Empedobacter falsenii]|uniref:Uncharacterized protein n=1 Tax=Empedobacter falsenii TaxID=343874 RepID=A0ABY8V7D3_9FLAO|nr:hypothetical protein [Empedobacter falsenii]WIH97491.1 hypothetical protein OBA43_00750 [Empedobacter falsenii]
MKLKLKNYILGVLGLVTLQQADAQVIFKDDFGKSEIRLPSQFVPETGRDSSLEGVFTHQSKFYKYAAIAPNYDGENVNQNTINNGYYAIVAPKFIYNNLPTGKPNWANWWTPIQNNTDQSDNGAVLVVNGDEVLNQYYRRAVSLEKGKTYRISVYLYGVGKNNVGVKFEAQNILSEKVLDESSDFLLSEANKWEQKSWTFKIPENDNCSNIAISLRNTIKTNDGNDFYVDDIVLEEYYDPTAPVIPCANEQVNFDDIIKATNDRFTFNSRGGKFDVLSNDALNKGNDQFILSGDKKNATIGKIGIWPEGFSFDSNGQLVIAPNAPNPGLPLVYQVCNLLGVCTTAEIVLEKDMGIPFAGNDDPFYWGNTTYNVIANDIYNDHNAGEGFVFSGSNQNMTISVKGNWPSGITMDANGVITIAAGTPKPTEAIFYTLCNMTGLCEDVQVTFLGSESPYPDWKPGSIKVENPDFCYDSTVKVIQETEADGPSPRYFLSGLRYSWEISFDNGASWKNYDEMLGVEPPKDDNSNANSSTGTIGSITVDKGYSITIENVTKPMLIRRKSNVYRSNTADGGSIGRFDSYTSPVLVTPSEENTIALPDKVNAFAVEQGKEFTFPTVSTKFPSTITIYDSEGKEVATTISDLKKGEYTYTIQATTITGAPIEGCVTSVAIQLIVYDLKDCDIVKKKIFATDVRDWTSGAGGVEGEEKAVNGNRADYATITGGLVVLGLGTTGVDLYFTKLSDPNDPKSKRVLYTAEELKGKKVTIKLGEQYSGLKLAGGLTVVGRHTTATNPEDIGIGIGNSNVGTSFGVKGGVLDLLKGDNVFQFSFIPAKTNGEHVGYNGVRIQLGSLLAVADMATVFYAYIEEEEEITSPDYKPLGDIIVNPPASLLYPSEQNDVDGTKLTGIKNKDIKLNEFTNDVTWGNRSEVLNVASGLSSVVHPYYAVDDNYDSYTLFNATAGVLNQQFLRTHLRQPARPGDQVQITLAYPNINVLNLSLLQLGNFKIVYYLGDTKVGEENMEKFRVLDIGLFNFKNKRRAVISKPITVPFDSFEIQQFSTVSVNLGDGMHVHDIRIAPMMLFEGQEDTKEVTKICAADFLAIQSPDFCTEYEISFAKVTKFGDPYTIPDNDEDPTNNLPLLDKDGKPIKEILKIEDIPNSQLAYSHTGAKVMYYSIDRLYTEYENEGIILVKVQTKRQGQNYGNPQYLRVKLENCNEALVNPVIRLSH